MGYHGPGSLCLGQQDGFVDETYVKVAWIWSYIDRHGQGDRRVRVTASRLCLRACVLYRCLGCSRATGEVITDRAPALANVIEDLTPGARHNTGQYENNGIECDHGRLKARLRPVGGAEDSTNGERGDPRARLHPESPPATTSLQSMPHRCYGWLPRSTNSDLRCDHHGHRLRIGMACDRTTQKCPWTSFIAVPTSGRGSAARGHRGGRSTHRREPSRRAEPPARDCAPDSPGR